MARNVAPVSELQEKVVFINRVSKVVKGGRRFSLSALVVVGDGEGRIGIGMGKSSEVPNAIKKAIDDAKKNMFSVPVVNGTLPHETVGEFGAARVVLKPAAPGCGVIAGGPARAVLELAGYTDVLTKSLGSSNPVNVVKATGEGLKSMQFSHEVARRRGKTVEEMFHVQQTASAKSTDAVTQEDGETMSEFNEFDAAAKEEKDFVQDDAARDAVSRAAMAEHEVVDAVLTEMFDGTDDEKAIDDAVDEEVLRVAEADIATGVVE